MAAVACLRVLLDGNRTDVPPERLGPLVAKYATCFLEVRWTFPRVSKSLSHYSYLLTDPTALELDTVELRPPVPGSSDTPVWHGRRGRRHPGSVRRRCASHRRLRWIFRR